MPEIVSNTGPLIALAAFNQIHLLQELFGTITIPAAVRAEILDENTRKALTSSDWITIDAVQDSIAVRLLNEELDPGESEAIVLARECNAALLLVDERAARRKAITLALPVIGTLGILLMAKKQALIPAIKPLLDDLRHAGFHMHDELYDQVCHSADERRSARARL